MNGLATQHWPSAVEAMRRHAAEVDDALLALVAEQVEQVVNTHWDSSAGHGCGSCYGDVSLCGNWDNAQAIVLTWLMQKAGVA